MRPRGWARAADDATMVRATAATTSVAFRCGRPAYPVNSIASLLANRRTIAAVSATSTSVVSGLGSSETRIDEAIVSCEL
jgi:hypothetical protein